MSAIAGIIDFNNNHISDKKINIIEKVSSNFCIDRIETYSEQGLFFSCFHQYFTNEAVFDVSPIINSEKSVIFNADIFLYNREEIINRLSNITQYASLSLKEKGDAELAYYIYMQYGIEIVNILSGAYSIVVYDKSINTVYLITDHVSARHLAYSLTDQQLYYSSTLHVISSLLEEHLSLDEEWICASYMDFSPATERLHGKTVYKNIYRVEPGHYIQINLLSKKADNVEYWNPLKTIKPIKLASDEEYGKLFRETFIKSVTQMLRARNNHGILLSGGLDSSSVASVAANYLAQFNKELFSYTQIPCPEYIYGSSRYSIENETEEVLKNQKRYPNIKCHFVCAKDLTVFSEPEKYIRCFAQPVKPILNSPYNYSMDEEAKHDNISVLLGGGFGNFTISYGNITSYVYQKNHSFHFISSIKEASAYCKLYKVGKPKLLKFYLKNKRKKKKKIELDTFIKEQLRRKYNLDSLTRKYYKSLGSGTVDSVQEWNTCVYKPLAYQHMSYFNTCRSLFTGAIHLDPTMTKDVIELCLALPIDCFVKKGKERRAVRDYLKGIVSDDILNNLKRRGVQAADYQFRANKYWDKTKNILYENLTVNELNLYMDSKNIKDLLEDIKKKEYNIDKLTIATATVTSVLGCFLKNYRKYAEVDKWTKIK